MTATLVPIVLILALCVPAGAHAARSPWTDADESRVRLLLSAADAGVHLDGGVEILLEPGWHTYWRNPGETGVPPVFDFSASENVAGVEVRYPAPERRDDGTSVSLVYNDEVVFPIEVTPLDPQRPVRLAVDVTFGVCREICIPTRARSELSVGADAASDPLADARLQTYSARVPGAADPGRFDVESVTPEPGALLIEVRMPESGYMDLFSDPPPGWYLGQPTLVSRSDQISRYRLPLTGGPDDRAPSGQTFRFVAVAGGEAIEKMVEIK